MRTYVRLSFNEVTLKTVPYEPLPSSDITLKSCMELPIDDYLWSTSYIALWRVAYDTEDNSLIIFKLLLIHVIS